jgi:pyruvate formate lyase activating enzyme
MWACAGRGQIGKHNLAVFYGSCTLNCLFCQNWHYREMSASLGEGGYSSGSADCFSARELAAAANQRTFCVCYFGGDPASQLPHALAASAALAESGLRICWETSGTANVRLMDRAVTYSLQTGGLVKFDIKAFDESLHVALTGVSNKRTLDNFARAGRRFAERPHNPLVMASTLLVPGYVDAEEVSRIAAFIAAINPDIPYALLAFGPNFYMPDLPTTCVDHAERAQEAARAAGLTNVRLGNRHLLSRSY